MVATDTALRATPMPDQLFIGYPHLGYPCEYFMDPIANTGQVKPIGGLWTSTLTSAGKSAWARFAPDYFAVHPTQLGLASILHPLAAARVAEIDNHVDLVALVDRYPSQHSGGPPVLDFEAMAADFDAVHLTASGEVATCHPAREVNLKMWSVESTLWFRWMFV